MYKIGFVFRNAEVMAFCVRLFPGGVSGNAERVLARSLAFDFCLPAVVVSSFTALYLKGVLAILCRTRWVITTTRAAGLQCRGRGAPGRLLSIFSADVAAWMGQL